MKSITKIALIAICYIAISFTATAQSGKVYRPRTSAPVTTLPVVIAVKDTTTAQPLGTAITQINQPKIDALVQLASPKCSLSGFITMPKEACKVPLTYLDRELYLQLFYLDSNDVMGKQESIKYTLTLAAASDVPADKIGFYYTVSNIPVNKKVFIRLIPSNIQNWNYEKDGNTLYFRTLNDRGNEWINIHFDGNPNYGWGDTGYKLHLYMGKNTFSTPGKAYLCNAEYVYQPWGSPH
jgi:hypothetical protein